METTNEHEISVGSFDHPFYDTEWLMATLGTGGEVKIQAQIDMIVQSKLSVHRDFATSTTLGAHRLLLKWPLWGYPRTFQIDQFGGHNESGGTLSHFVAINFHSHIEVIELPGGDATHARIFIGPQLYTDGNDLVPVTLSFLDVNSDHRPDMIIEFEGSQVAFINDQGTFRPLRPQERRQVEDFLQHHGP